MEQEEKPIEPEIVDIEETKQNKENKNKKVWAWIWLIASIIYGINPMDMDFAPVVGWIDDLLFFGAAATNFVQQQFFQTNDTLNKVLKILKWLLISVAVLILLVAILIITVLIKK